MNSYSKGSSSSSEVSSSLGGSSTLGVSSSSRGSSSGGGGGGRSLKVLVVESTSGLAGAEEATEACLATRPLHHVGYVNVAAKTSWLQLDGLVYAAVTVSGGVVMEC